MQNNKKQHLAFITFVYSIGAILVIFGHSYPLGKSFVPEFLISFRTFIYCFHMPLFFFIAGLLMKYSNDKNTLDSRGQHSNFIAKKAHKLLIPYFILAIIAVIPKFLVTQYISDHISLNVTYFIKIFLVPRENVWGHLWFIPVLFIFFCFSHLLLKAVQRTWLTLLLTSMFLTLNIYPINNNWFGIRDICNYGLYFWFGLITSDYLIAKQKKIFSKKKGLLAMIIAIILFISLSYIVRDKISLKNILSAFIGLLMIYTIFAFGMEYQHKEYMYFNWLNGKVFTLFLLSWPCQAIVEICLNKILGFNWFVVMMSMFLAGLLGPLFIMYLYEKFKIQNRFLKTIIGIT